MTDKPSAAVRGKPNSSMAVGLRLQAEGQSDAFVSAGNTGAQMAASMVVLQLHAGLKRPAIATLFPTARQAGRRPRLGRQRRLLAPRSSCSSRGSAPSTPRTCSAGRIPAVGLLSIGEEPEKGNAVDEGGAPAAPERRAQLPRQRRRARPARRRHRARRDRRRRLRRLRRQRGAQVLRGDRAAHDRDARARPASIAEQLERRAQAPRLLRARRRAAARREGRQHHLARQVVAARDQERHQGRRAGRRERHERAHRRAGSRAAAESAA